MTDTTAQPMADGSTVDGSTAEGAGFLHDERGSRSTARALLWIWSLFAAGIFAAAFLTHRLGEFAQAEYAFLTAPLGILATGAFGPRVAQYLAPQLTGILSSLGQAKRDARLPSRLDDER